MRRPAFPAIVFQALVIATLAAGSTASVRAQNPPPVQSPPPMSRDEIVAFAKVHIAVSATHDSIDAQLAQPGNKKDEAQRQLQEKLVAQVQEILHHNGMTDAEYRRKTFLVSTNGAVRKTFDSVVAALTGVPTPGQAPAVAAGRGGPPPVTNLPPGAVCTHIGHVVNGFSDTPNGMGLLPVAMAEARTAVTHAGLAARQPGNLDYMKLHAGHVINALDPTVIPTGPGLGYGVKKAATGVATHIELAAKAAGASPNVILHANHVATAARNTVKRADSLLVIAKMLQASTSAADAAALVSQMVSLANQLTAGYDVNNDGTITWDEGGLQHCQEHINLMLAGEKPGG